MRKQIRSGQKQRLFLTRQTSFPHLDLSCEEISEALSVTSS